MSTWLRRTRVNSSAASEGGLYMNEKIYKTMGSVGTSNLALGIIVMLTGIVSGILLIVHGARLLKNRKNVLI